MAGNEQSLGEPRIFLFDPYIKIAFGEKNLPEVRRWGLLNLPYISMKSKVSGLIFFGHSSG